MTGATSERSGVFAALASLFGGTRSVAPAMLGCLALTTALFLATPPSASAAPSAWWGLTSAARPTNLAPGSQDVIVATAANIGDADAGGPVTITDRLPAGVTIQTNKVQFRSRTHGSLSGSEDLGPRGAYAALHLCTVSASEVSCTYHTTAELEALGFTPAAASEFFPLRPYMGRLEMRITVKVAPETEVGALPNQVSVAGGGGPSDSISKPLHISEEPAPFGIEDFQFRLEEEGGAPATQAGSHLFQLTNVLDFNQGPESTNGNEEVSPVQQPRDLSFKLPPGMIGNVTALPKCSAAQFGTEKQSEGGFFGISCPPDTQIGVATVTYFLPPNIHLVSEVVPVFNLEPKLGEPARFGFLGGVFPITLDSTLRSGNGEDYGITVSTENITQLAGALASEVTFWGTPGDPVHDNSRGYDCLHAAATCELVHPQQPKAFLTTPTSCPTNPMAEPFAVGLLARSWLEPLGTPHPEATSVLQSPSGTPLGVVGCNQLVFTPEIAGEPTSNGATSPTGLNFELNFHDEGLTNPEGLAQSQLKKAVVTLPEGMSTNPSVAEGLKACSQAEYESATDQPGTGCLEESKIGQVEIESPLVEEKVLGSLYVATQNANPNHNLLTIYLIAQNPNLGILVRQALKVEPNPVTGQLTTVVDNVPQLPFSHFDLSFRQGQRSPLVTPPACGAYAVKAALYPYSQPTTPVLRESPFQLTTGPEGQGCPSGGVPPFHPNLLAGSENPTAGAYSPFYTEITRKDSEQEITHFSIKLPPGVIGKLAGVSSCSDAAIAAAKAREKEGGGQEELNSPSCPANSEIGHSNVGSGVGNVLAYAPGKLYLAGPYHGSNLSIVSITAAKVGPFDLGTVVVRFALKIDPETAEVSVDGAGSDPIPHIVDGIPIHLRDIQAFVDRKDFTLNPTSCQKKSTASTVLGSGLNFASETDDQPVTITSPFQVGSCASLGFKPKLALSLKGGTKRGGTPAFKAVLTYPKGSYANIAKSVVTLPHSEFLEQSHIKTICTRVQFKEGRVPGEKCPAASIYGRAEAVTPLLAEPLKGPVYLRSSSHNLPDLVAALHNNQVDFALDGRIDSIKNGRIRNTFETVPDAPVSKFVLEMQGGKKGLLVNSTNLCAHTNRAISEFTGQNGKLHNTNPVLSAKCGGKGKKKSKASKGGKAH